MRLQGCVLCAVLGSAHASTGGHAGAGRGVCSAAMSSVSVVGHDCKRGFTVNHALGSGGSWVRDASAPEWECAQETQAGTSQCQRSVSLEDPEGKASAGRQRRRRTKPQ